MRLAVLCGGPSAERGISLNSARSVMDHLSALGWEIDVFYCDVEKRFYRLSPHQLYSNTPSDFDFKLARTASPLTEDAFIEACRQNDLVFPAIHGAFGEDGELQAFLEENAIPFVGSSSATCRKMFDKATANRHMAQHGFATLPHCRVTSAENDKEVLARIESFFAEHKLQRAVVKPSAGGSSLGVATVVTPQDAAAKVADIFLKGLGGDALIEPFCEGQEFTVVVLQNAADDPVALLPTEIELIGGDIFSFRHKYLPTCHVEYHCPPRFTDALIGQIRSAAEVLYSFFEMRDFARLDGWLLSDGRVVFSDFNPISGMEQNSFLFIQGSRIGLSHGEILRFIVAHAARRAKLTVRDHPPIKKRDARRVRVLFGGSTAERQVSLMSGTNVWLKLLPAPDFRPEPYLLSADETIWALPYAYTLNHTVEEILLQCERAETIALRLKVLVPPVRQKLGLPPLPANTALAPRPMTVGQFLREAQDEDAFVFLALHGGAGEDGTFQTQLDASLIAYNGSGPEASRLCMDKYATGKRINDLNDPDLTAAPKIDFSMQSNAADLWARGVSLFRTTDLLIKPQADGCSAGVARLQSAEQLSLYLEALRRGDPVLPAGALHALSPLIELPPHPDELLLEPFIRTDEVRLGGFDLTHRDITGWIELTVGVLEHGGVYHALSPSITVAQDAVLSLEEKFQGGTGINLTPPPDELVSAGQVAFIRAATERAAQTLGIEGYARIDIFFNRKTEQTLVIEANSLPGLTASTVIFHQALAENPPLAPRAFLTKVIENGFGRRDRLRATRRSRSSQS